MSDLSEVYSTTYNWVNRHIVHFKKPATEEIILQFDDVDAANSPTQSRTKVFYPQNGESGYYNGYQEGTTTCPGTNGCNGLDTRRRRRIPTAFAAEGPPQGDSPAVLSGEAILVVCGRNSGVYRTARR